MQVYTVVTKGGTDNIFVPLYALFMALWATLTVEGWKREQVCSPPPPQADRTYVFLS